MSKHKTLSPRYRLSRELYKHVESCRIDCPAIGQQLPFRHIAGVHAVKEQDVVYYLEISRPSGDPAHRAITRRKTCERYRRPASFELQLLACFVNQGSKQVWLLKWAAISARSRAELNRDQRCAR